MYFSHNVPTLDREGITQLYGFSVTLSLGKYLGIPLIFGRISKELHEQVLSCVRHCLTGWSAKMLSMTRRVTLARSVLQTIPFYAMHVLKIPEICLYGV